MVDSIEKDLNFILTTRPTKQLVLEVHPYVAAYLKRGLGIINEMVF